MYLIYTDRPTDKVSSFTINQHSILINSHEQLRLQLSLLTGRLTYFSSSLTTRKTYKKYCMYKLLKKTLKADQIYFVYLNTLYVLYVLYSLLLAFIVNGLNR